MKVYKVALLFALFSVCFGKHFDAPENGSCTKVKKKYCNTLLVYIVLQKNIPWMRPTKSNILMFCC